MTAMLLSRVVSMATGILIMIGSTTHAQSDFLCPPNPAMGLCDHVTNPCFSDANCNNGEICCPHACSRVCKARGLGGPGGSGSVGSIPDLLHHPRVYVGKCPDASCYSMFGGGPNQCDTSNLCPDRKYCCNDGCKNVCLWRPEVAVMLAKQEAKRKQEQMIIMQKQEQELRKREQQLLLEQQQQLLQARAKMEKERQLAMIRQAAVIKDQKARILAAKQLAEAKRLENLEKQQQYRQQLEQQQQIQQQFLMQQQIQQQQQLEQQQQIQQQRLMQQQIQQQQQTNAGPYSSLPATNVNNVKNGGLYGASKKDFQSGSLANQINSPANSNPYSAILPQTVANNKQAPPTSVNPYYGNSQTKPLPLVMAPPSLPANQNQRTPYFPPSQVSHNPYAKQINMWTNKKQFSTSRQAPPASTNIRHHGSQPRPSASNPVEPFLMYHFMEAV